MDEMYLRSNLLGQCYVKVSFDGFEIQCGRECEAEKQWKVCGVM
jgi:hypothetical protein